LFYTYRFKIGKYWMTSPTTVIQYADDEETQIQWDPNTLASLGTVGITTVKPLLHVARSPKYDLTNTTWYMKCTGFNFTDLPTTISGITVTIKMNRGGRITDDVIQLCYQDNLIGESRAQPAYINTVNQDQSFLYPTTTYGGTTDTWKVDNITTDMIQDPTFGVVVRYKSHPRWPHRTSPIMYSIAMQIN